MSDQVPVWMKADSGRRLMPTKQLQAASAARKARKRRAAAVAAGEQDAAADQQPRDLVCAAGNPANSKSRYTLICRQLVHNYFREEEEPRGSDMVSGS